MNAANEKERAWLWLNTVIGPNPQLTDKLIYLNDGLLGLFGSARNGGAIRLPDGIPETKIKELRSKSSDGAIDSFIEKLFRSGISTVTRDSEHYPKLLREIYDPPTVLFVKGRLKADVDLPIAVVGSRKCSDYGREMAGYFAEKLVENGACIISGMAVGCDSIAAQGALKVRSSEYPTIAVLGSGIDIVYPSSNRRLYDEIAERGAVISEYKPGRQPTRESFPQRNRIISGLSKGVLVIEAGAKSGTSITVGFAHEQGRDVFAIPGRITDLTSLGTNRLIKSGAAKAVFGVDDILYEYGKFLETEDSPVHGSAPRDLPREQKLIFDQLILGEKTADEICEITLFSVSEVNTYLTEMELSGIIRQLPNGLYSV